MADSGGWRWQTAVLKRQFPNIRITSAYRPQSQTATGNKSLHGEGRAVDIGLTPYNPTEVFMWIKANFPDSRELIYSPMNGKQVWNGKEHLYGQPTRGDHFDHIHWAYIGPTDPNAGYIQQPGTVGAGLLDDPLGTATGLTGETVTHWVDVVLNWTTYTAMSAVGGIVLVIGLWWVVGKPATAVRRVVQF